jgi:hypothetical protein
MKKNLQIIALLIGATLLTSSVVLAQNVGINATGAAPDASAMLDIVSANRGLLVPRVALTATNAAGPIAAPTTSLLVYNTATAGAGLTAVTPGYYYWDGAAWVRFQASNTIDDWKLLGNAGTTAGTNFVGTTDAQHLDFRTNSTQRMRIMNSTHPTVGIGTAFPVTTLSGTTAVVHIHDGGASVGSQLILSNHSTASGARAGLINFATTQVTNDKRTASIESYLTNYTAPNATGDLRFFTNNANSYTEKMRIEGDGDVGIGATPDASAKLDVSATNKGLLAPRVALTATNVAGPITAPATSLLVYNTATAGAAPNNVTPGYYYWNGSAWVRFDTGNNIGDWKILGNAGTVAGTNFLGTTDNVVLQFRTNNLQRFEITSGTAVTGGHLRASNNGLETAPTYSWTGNTTTGMFSPAASTIGFTTNNTERFRIPNAAQVHAMATGTNLLPFYSWGADPNTGMYRPGNDILGFSTNALERMRIEADGDVGIGATPNASAKLDVTATDRGFLAPRVALTATNAAGPIATPATGLLVYNTATAGGAPNNVVPGYYYNSGTPAAPVWARFSTGNGEGWQTIGNNGTNPTNNFIGTIDNQSFVFRANNTERMRIHNTGNVVVGTNAIPLAGAAFSGVANATFNTGILGLANGGLATSIQQQNANSNGLFVSNTAANGTGTGIALIATSNQINNSSTAIFGLRSLNFYTNSAVSAVADATVAGGIGIIASSDNATGVAIQGQTTGAGASTAIVGINSGLNVQAVGIYGLISGNTAGTGFTNNTVRKSIYGQGNSATGSYRFGIFGDGGTSIRSGGVMGDDYGTRGALGYFASIGADYSVYGFGGAYQVGAAAGMNPATNNNYGLTADNNGLIGVKKLNFSSSDSEVDFASWSNHDINNHIGIGIYGGVMGGWIKGLVYGTNLSGAKYGLYVHGKTITNNVITTLNDVPGTKERVPTYATMAMKVEVTDKGKASVVNGKATIKFDEAFSKIISANEPVIISVTPLGSSKGFYILSSDVNGFTILENENGSSNVDFYWMAIGVKSGSENVTISPEIITKDFEEKINGNQGVMYNDNNPLTPKYSLWYDGRTVRFDLPPLNREPLKIDDNLIKKPIQHTDIKVEPQPIIIEEVID